MKSTSSSSHNTVELYFILPGHQVTERVWEWDSRNCKNRNQHNFPYRCTYVFWIKIICIIIWSAHWELVFQEGVYMFHINPHAQQNKNLLGILVDVIRISYSPSQQWHYKLMNALGRTFTTSGLNYMNWRFIIRTPDTISHALCKVYWTRLDAVCFWLDLRTKNQ